MPGGSNTPSTHLTYAGWDTLDGAIHRLVVCTIVVAITLHLTFTISALDDDSTSLDEERQVNGSLRL